MVLNNEYESELDELLRLVSDNINIEHCHEIDEKYKATLSYEYVDRPPLIAMADFGFDFMRLPPPWDKFRFYSYKETFDNPAAMLQNQILNIVVPGLILKDDNPLAIRNNHGTIQIASLLGGNWTFHMDNNPWVEHFSSISFLRDIVLQGDALDFGKGILLQSFKTLEFYREKLDRFPPCAQAIQISLPDLEGPMNTANQLWGSDIYYAFFDEPELISGLFEKIAKTMTCVSELFRKYSTDRLDPVANTQHFYQIPGRLLIRDDSSILLSPDLYKSFVKPHIMNILEKIGGGSIHFCGNGQHLISEMLEIPLLKGLDFGDPNYMDISGIYRECSEKHIAITNLTPSRDELTSGKAAGDYPTGVVFVYYTSDINDAKDVLSCYHTG